MIVLYMLQQLNGRFMTEISTNLYECIIYDNRTSFCVTRTTVCRQGKTSKM